MQVRHDNIVKMVTFFSGIEGEDVNGIEFADFVCGKESETKDAILHTVLRGLKDKPSVEKLIEAVIGDKLKGWNNAASERIKEFMDPITNTFMENPVICVGNGKFFEKSSIERHFTMHSTCPVSGRNMTERDMQTTPSPSFRELGKEFLVKFFGEAKKFCTLVKKFFPSMLLSKTELKETGLFKEVVRMYTHSIFPRDYDFMVEREEFFSGICPDDFERKQECLLSTLRHLFRHFVERKREGHVALELFQTKIQPLLEAMVGSSSSAPAPSEYEFYYKNVLSLVYSEDIARKYVALIEKSERGVVLEALLKKYPEKAELVEVYVEELQQECIPKVFSYLQALESEARGAVMKRLLKYAFHNVGVVVSVAEGCQGKSDQKMNSLLIRGLSSIVKNLCKSKSRTDKTIKSLVQHMKNSSQKGQKGGGGGGGGEDVGILRKRLEELEEALTQKTKREVELEDEVKVLENKVDVLEQMNSIIIRENKTFDDRLQLLENKLISVGGMKRQTKPSGSGRRSYIRNTEREYPKPKPKRSTQIAKRMKKIVRRDTTRGDEKRGSQFAESESESEEEELEYGYDKFGNYTGYDPANRYEQDTDYNYYRGKKSGRRDSDEYEEKKKKKNVWKDTSGSKWSGVNDAWGSSTGYDKYADNSYGPYKDTWEKYDNGVGRGGKRRGDIIPPFDPNAVESAYQKNESIHNGDRSYRGGFKKNGDMKKSSQQQQQQPLQQQPQPKRIKKRRVYDPKKHSRSACVRMSKKVVIENVPENVRSDDLARFLEKRLGAGSYSSIKYQQLRNVYTVEFASDELAEKALKLDGVKFRGRKLDLSPTLRFKDDRNRFCVRVVGLPITAKKRFIKNVFGPIVGIIFRIHVTDEFTDLFLASKQAVLKCLNVNDVNGKPITTCWITEPN